MKIIKIFEDFLNEDVDKYNVASHARQIYYLCKSYDVKLEDMSKLFKNTLLNEYLVALSKLDISKFKEGDIVEVLDGEYKGKIGSVSNYQNIDDWLRVGYPAKKGIGVYVAKLNPHEASSIEKAKTWAEVPSASLINATDLKKIK